MRIKTGVAYGELTTLPGCSQIVVSHGVFIPPQLRNTGSGTKANKKRLKIIKLLGYNYVICTVNDTNIKQKAIMKTNQWNELDSFMSSKSDNLIRIFGKRI